jgi:Zn-dependent peptidase ImmA (M78 family)
MIKKKIDERVNEILHQLKIDELPIPIEKIANKLNLAVVPADLGPDVSGALIIDEGKATIGINVGESKVRRRFTIAHELGHYCLHKSNSNLFVEMKVFFRDLDSSSGEEKKEREANEFAATILMPSSLIKRELTIALKDNTIKNDESLIRHLAKKFNVSEIAMTYRLINLNYLQ